MIGGVLAAAVAGAPARAGPAAIGLPTVPAVVIFDFDPVVTILGISIRWQIAAVAASILIALLLAAAIALVADRRRAAALAADPERATAVAEAVEAALQTVRAAEAVASSAEVAASSSVAPEAGSDASPPPDRTEPLAGAATAAADRPAAAHHDRPSLVDHPWLVSLRLDDLLFITIAGAAGAVVGGRLGYALLYFDVYRLDPSAVLDPARGSLTLAGGVALGVLTGILVATILGAPVRRWLGVAVVPLLLALCLGKLAMILGGAGQGLPSDVSWATAYAGPGPWGSLAPMLPSVPAQAIEAGTSAAALGLVVLLALVASLRRHAAILFAIGLGLWALGRFAVAFTWRDPTLVGPLNGDQLVTAGIAVLAGASLVAAAISDRRDRTALAIPETIPPPGAEVALEASTPPALEPGAPRPPDGGDRQEAD